VSEIILKSKNLELYRMSSICSRLKPVAAHKKLEVDGIRNLLEPGAIEIIFDGAGYEDGQKKWKIESPKSN
jgi:hypothetical protein